MKNLIFLYCIFLTACASRISTEQIALAEQAALRDAVTRDPHFSNSNLNNFPGDGWFSPYSGKIILPSDQNCILEEKTDTRFSNDQNRKKIRVNCF